MSFGGPGINPDSATKYAWNNKRTRWRVQTNVGPPVYLRVRDGRIDFPLVIDGELMNSREYFESHGAIPPILEMCCPRCGERNMIPGTKKTIKVVPREPKRFAHPHDGEQCVQLFIVSVQEAMVCNQPAKSGKGICGYAFRITENVIHPA